MDCQALLPFKIQSFIPTEKPKKQCWINNYEVLLFVTVHTKLVNFSILPRKFFPLHHNKIVFNTFRRPGDSILTDVMDRFNMHAFNC